jgi:hypoxanthine-DNA glycosylase
MHPVHSFPPVIGPAPRVLILGSVPGVASLEQQQYYAKPQNAFWRIMGALFDAGPGLAYPDRLERLTAQHIALWDVLASCIRPGSLDSSIDLASAQINDLTGLLRAQPTLSFVFFNGRKAEQMYRRWVLAEAQSINPHVRYYGMPSTSPAMATLTFAEKLDRWRMLRRCLDSPAEAMVPRA